MRKGILTAVLAVVLIGALLLVLRLINGAIIVAESAFSTVLGIGVVIAMVLIVLWMFSYAKKR